MVLKLLFAFNAQKRVPGQLVFSMVAKIITQQVGINQLIFQKFVIFKVIDQLYSNIYTMEMTSSTRTQVLK